MGPEGLILVGVMGAISLSAAGGAVVMARRSWGVLTGDRVGFAGIGGSLHGFDRTLERPVAQHYAGWGRERRVAHWVQSIARHARAAADAGVPAASVLDGRLVDQMRRTDPHIELLLPLVLTDLAVSEGVEPADLSAAFARGTGMEVQIPPALVEERREARRARL